MLLLVLLILVAVELFVPMDVTTRKILVVVILVIGVLLLLGVLPVAPLIMLR